MALNAGCKAVEPSPESSDALEGPYWLDLAQVYAMNRDVARAQPLIEHPFRTAVSMTTIAIPKPDPVWDPLRNNPGFAKLVQRSQIVTASPAR